jgi:hypothetical protein
MPQQLGHGEGGREESPPDGEAGFIPSLPDPGPASKVVDVGCL